MRDFLLSVASIVTYLFVGTSWAFLRWRKFVKTELRYYEWVRQRFLTHHRVQSTEVPEYLKADWREYVEANIRLKAIPPSHENYTTNLALNLSLWPISMLSLTGQFIYRNTVRRLIVESMDSTNSKISQIKKDLR